MRGGGNSHDFIESKTASRLGIADIMYVVIHIGPDIRESIKDHFLLEMYFKFTSQVIVFTVLQIEGYNLFYAHT